MRKCDLCDFYVTWDLRPCCPKCEKQLGIHGPQCEKQLCDPASDTLPHQGQHGATGIHSVQSCSSRSQDRKEVEPVLPETTLPGGIWDDTILELHLAYSSAVTEYLSPHHGSQPIDMTRGMIESVSMPCEKVSAKEHRSTQQCLISLTQSQEIITPAHVENTGRDVMSNEWDDHSHHPEASFSRSSTLQDGSYSRIVSEVGSNSYSSSGPTRR